MNDKPATRTILVRCTFVIPVEVPVDADYDAHSNIEESHCPGTGLVGRALDEHIRRHQENSTCWACALGGENKIVSEFDL